ncbi:hypothetical protein [Actinomadura sp. 6N118]|uniref:hypothetical protein n=1 Tax=Actinomadura sp. 6N118 TaxID=3375151 RepID=UPI0037A55DFE
MSVATLVKRVEVLLKQAEAQEADHTPRLTSSIPRWQTMLTEMEKTRDDLRAKTREVAPIWPDAAGELYGQRLGRSSASVDAWAQQLSSAGIPAQLEGLNQVIATTAQSLRALHQEALTLEQEYNQLQAELSAGVTPARAQYIIQRLAAIRARMMAIVAEAEGLITTLSGEFARVGSVIAGAPNGTPWDGPATSSGPGTTSAPSTGGPAAPAAAPGGSPAGSPAGTPAAPGGAPSGGAGGASAGAPAAGGAPAPALPGNPGTTAPSPVVPPVAVPPPSIPAPTPPLLAASTSSSTTGPTPASPGGVPHIAPIGALGAGAGLARVTPVSGNTGGTGQATTPGIGPVPPGTVGAGGTGSGGGGAGTGRMGVPPPMVPPGGGGSGTSGAPKPGDDDPRYRDRSPRNVPGVPPRLRGRAGRFDASPEFLGTANGPAAKRDAEVENETSQPLVEELWQVEEQTPVVEAPPTRRTVR